MFANTVTDTIEIDGDEGTPIPVQIRKLSRRSLEAASETRQRKVAQVAKEMGAEMVKAYRDQSAKEEATKVLDPAEARFAAYDVETVLVNGITSWEHPTPVAEGIPELDADTADKLFRAIVKLSVPTPEERAAAEGKS